MTTVGVCLLLSNHEVHTKFQLSSLIFFFLNILSKVLKWNICLFDRIFIILLSSQSYRSVLDAVVNTTKISKALQATRGNPSHGADTLQSQFDRVSKFKDRLPSEKISRFNQVHLGTVFANLLSPSFMCIMLVMPK